MEEIYRLNKNVIIPLNYETELKLRESAGEDGLGVGEEFKKKKGTFTNTELKKFTFLRSFFSFRLQIAQFF